MYTKGMDMKIDWAAVTIAIMIVIGVIVIYQAGKIIASIDCERAIAETAVDPYG